MRFLLTAVGTNNNSTVAKYLKETPDNYVVGTDIYPADISRLLLRLINFTEFRASMKWKIISNPY